ncbi:hypothetical protein SY88_00630 [Clostridiales bacterium PH28_bin88]|nr:hypothetical protein SY88_00630 [Clostridiales bacterium PH28_bin88]
MHIAEGLLPAQWAVAYYGAAGIIVAKGMRQYRARSREYGSFRQLTGLLTAAVFIISLLPIPVPIAGTSSHPGGTPLAAILMGPFIATMMSVVALFLQALLLAHGGLTTLGANALAMGIGGMVGFAVFRTGKRVGLHLPVAAGFAGLAGDLSIYAATSAQLALALNGIESFDKAFSAIYLAYLPTQLPLAVMEGAFTALVIRYLMIRRPDILTVLRVMPPEASKPVEVTRLEL